MVSVDKIKASVTGVTLGGGGLRWSWPCVSSCRRCWSFVKARAFRETLRARRFDVRGDPARLFALLLLLLLLGPQSSGALFARKFDYVKSYQVYQAMQNDLRNRDRSAARLDHTRARFGLRASDKGGRDDFCGGGYKGFRRRTEEQRDEGGGGVGAAAPR